MDKTLTPIDLVLGTSQGGAIPQKELMFSPMDGEPYSKVYLGAALKSLIISEVNYLEENIMFSASPIIPSYLSESKVSP